MKATILVANKQVSKEYRLDGDVFVKTKGYPLIGLWKREPVNIPDDVDALLNLLSGMSNNSAITLSLPYGDVPFDRPTRRLSKPKDDHQATLKAPDGCTCFVLDLDNWPLDDPFNTLDPREQIGIVRDKMGLGNYSCVWQLTSSARYGSMFLSARLWFLLDSPLSMKILHDAAENLGADESVYHPAQVIYTAPPMFIGSSDPISNRFDVLLSDFDVVPASRIKEIAGDNVKKSAGEYLGTESAFPRLGFNQILGNLGDGEGLGGFHNVLLRYTLKAVGRKMKRDNIKANCRQAIASAPKSKARDNADITRYMSDCYLNDLISGADNRIKGDDVLPQKHAVEPTSTAISLDDAEIKIDQIVNDFCKNPTQTVLKVTVGAGKTHAVSHAIANWLTSNPTGNVAWFAPTHNQAIEVAAAINAILPGTAIRIKGRLLQDSDNEPTPCGRPDVIRTAQEKGLSRYVKRLCCVTEFKEKTFYCPLWTECLYYAQFKANHRVRILPHSYINLPSAAAFTWEAWKKNIALVIVDESPINIITGAGSHSIDDIIVLGGGIAEAVKHAINGTSPANKDELAEKIIKQSCLDNILGLFPDIGASMSTKGLIDCFNAFKPNSMAKYSRLSSVLLKWLQGDFNSIWPGLDKRIHFAWQNKAELLENALFLDATAHKEIYHAALGDGLVFHEITVKQNLHVVQVSDELFSKRSLNNTLITRIGGLATALNAGLITHKCAQEQLTESFPSHTIQTAHFMALRGINAMQDLDALVIAGRIEPPALAVEARARALWPRESLNVTGSYEWQAGDYGGVSGHSDPRVDVVLRDIRDGEMAQAIGRLRAVRSKSTKLLLVVTNAPCPVLVDQTITVDELLPDYRFSAVAIRDGVLIQSDKWLFSRHPDLFETQKAAKRWTESSSVKGPQTLIEILLNKGFGALKNTPSLIRLQTAEFRAKNQRGSLAKAVMWTNDHTARIRIEELTGKTVTVFLSNENRVMKTSVKEAQPEMEWVRPEFKVIEKENIEDLLLTKLEQQHPDIFITVLPDQLLKQPHMVILKHTTQIKQVA
ncbi:MAG: hypothetical protein WCS87_18740 [Methylococcaceae bacterium]